MYVQQEIYKNKPRTTFNPILVLIWTKHPLSFQ